MIRKRAPGGGRKPRGEFAGKSAAFTTRVTPTTRRALEQAAKASGRSLSQEAEYILRTFLDNQDAFIEAMERKEFNRLKDKFA